MLLRIMQRELKSRLEYKKKQLCFESIHSMANAFHYHFMITKEHRRPVDKQTALSPPQDPYILLLLLNSLNLIVTVYEKEERHISLKEVRPLNFMVFTRKTKLIVRFFSIRFLCLGHLYYL